MTIPDSVQTIGKSAFYNNPNLETASIPSRFADTKGNFFETHALGL
ncbi:leucine-rich repeat protein [Enterococcus sp. LJL90]